MEQELAYSFHLGSDKNKSKLAKKVAKENVSGITSLSNNAIQNAKEFKGFSHSIMSHFHKRICYDKDNNYKIVSDDLYKNGIFGDNNNEIANNIYRKVKPKNEINNDKKNKKKNILLLQLNVDCR